MATQILQMVRQLMPMVRFDGYHVLADVTGVPDLFQRIKPTLLGLLPWRWTDPEAAAAQALGPGRGHRLGAGHGAAAGVLPGSPWCSRSRACSAPPGTTAGSSRPCSPTACPHGDIAGAAVRVLAITCIALPVLGIFYILLRLVARQFATGPVAKTRGRPLQRGHRHRRRRRRSRRPGLGLVARRRDLPPGPALRARHPGRRGHGVFPAAFTGAASRGPGGQDGDGLAAGRTAHPRRSRSWRWSWSPRACTSDTSRSGDAAARHRGYSAPAAAPSWVFPFDQPGRARGRRQPGPRGQHHGRLRGLRRRLRPGLGRRRRDVGHRNEAYAFASCTDCAAVAVGFQVVLIVGQADVVVPENLSAAANYNCVRCLTYALASQLVLTLDGPLSD